MVSRDRSRFVRHSTRWRPSELWRTWQLFAPTLGATLLYWYQFAFQPGGSESAGLLLKAATEHHFAFDTDAKNAYGEENRAVMLTTLYNTPQLAPIWRMVDWAYSSPSEVLLRGNTGLYTNVLLPCNGVRAGDPFGMLLYCIAVKAIIDRAIEEAGEGTVFPIAVADNVTFVGPVDGRATTAVTRRYVELGATIGVSILGAKNRALNFSNAHLHDEVHRLVADLGGSIINDATACPWAPTPHSSRGWRSTRLRRTTSFGFWRYHRCRVTFTILFFGWLAYHAGITLLVLDTPASIRRRWITSTARWRVTLPSRWECPSTPFAGRHLPLPPPGPRSAAQDSATSPWRTSHPSPYGVHSPTLLQP